MTDKTKEALKRALDWIEGNGKYDVAKRIAQAIREALAEQPAIKQDLTPEQPAQPQREPVCYKHGDEPKQGCAWCDKQPAQQQEPVATMWQHGETGRTRITMPGDITDCDARWFKVSDLYTSPPAQQEPSTLFESFQEFGEGWERLAWELCADENGEEACNDLIWEGGPIPEPWGDRWLKYEDEAKRLIALVHKHTSPPYEATPLASQRSVKPWLRLTDEEVKHEWVVWRASIPRYMGFAKGIEAKLKEKNA